MRAFGPTLDTWSMYFLQVVDGSISPADDWMNDGPQKYQILKTRPALTSIVLIAFTIYTYSYRCALKCFIPFLISTSAVHLPPSPNAFPN